MLQHFYFVRNESHEIYLITMILNRMDVRKFNVVNVDESKGQIELRPKMDKELEENVRRFEEESSGKRNTMEALNWVIGIISNNKQASNIWQK